ncbi:MAG: NADH-quinone oxidoreductase subunit K [Synergistaceae bacterium]|nr:NADH-quinone oxidoreductase subunit K [Synergistaceae bacterium]
MLLENGSGGWLTSSALYVNPVPAGLVLTGIVVSVSVTAFALALTLKLYESYGTLNIDEALLKMTQEQEELEAKIEEAEEEILA